LTLTPAGPAQGARTLHLRPTSFFLQYFSGITYCYTLDQGVTPDGQDPSRTACYLQSLQKAASFVLCLFVLCFGGAWSDESNLVLSNSASDNVLDHLLVEEGERRLLLVLAPGSNNNAIPNSVLRTVTPSPAYRLSNS